MLAKRLDTFLQLLVLFLLAALSAASAPGWPSAHGAPSNAGALPSGDGPAQLPLAWHAPGAPLPASPPSDVGTTPLFDGSGGLFALDYAVPGGLVARFAAESGGAPAWEARLNTSAGASQTAALPSPSAARLWWR